MQILKQWLALKMSVRYGILLFFYQHHQIRHFRDTRWIGSFIPLHLTPFCKTILMTIAFQSASGCPVEIDFTFYVSKLQLLSLWEIAGNSASNIDLFQNTLHVQSESYKIYCPCLCLVLLMRSYPSQVSSLIYFDVLVHHYYIF